MKDKLSRCTVLAGVALSVAAASAQAAAVPSVVKANDEAFQSILDRQLTDPDSRWTWAMPVRLWRRRQLYPSREAGHNRNAADVIQFGPGRRESDYTQARGSRPKLPGPSAYLTAYTPFDHTLTFDWC